MLQNIDSVESHKPLQFHEILNSAYLYDTLLHGLQILHYVHTLME